MKSQLVVSALISLSAARFHAYIDIERVAVGSDGPCSATFTINDDVLGWADCPTTNECHGNGDGQIANAHAHCRTAKGDADIFVYPHDTLKFCRTGFCSCMSTRYLGYDASSKVGVAHFEADDEHAWPC